MRNREEVEKVIVDIVDRGSYSVRELFSYLGGR
jgi:hypothetical protein